MRPSVQSRAVAEVPDILRPRHPSPVAVGIPGLIGLVCFPHLTWLLMDWYRTFMLLENKLIAPKAMSSSSNVEK